MFRAHVLIVRRAKLYYTVSGIITPIGGRPVHRLRDDSVSQSVPCKGNSVPLQAWSGPEGSRKLRFPDVVTTAQDGGRLSALCTGRLYPQ